MAFVDFSVQQTDLKSLEKFFKRAPRAAHRASAGMMNTFAFGTRKKALVQLNINFHIRNPGFVKRSVQVTRARGSVPFNSQFAEVGSIARGTPGSGSFFSGWKEQELGTTTKRTRLQTLDARGGSWQGKVKGPFRLKGGAQFPNPDDFKGKDANHRVVVMLQVLSKKGGVKPFIIRGSSKIKPGLYRFKNKKLRRLQSTDPSQSDLQPKKKPWLMPAVRKFRRQNSVRKVWARAIEFELNRIRK